MGLEGNIMERSRSQEEYYIGYSQAAVQHMERRRASDRAAFFVPYLRPAMILLDCGCGPGTITCDLAALVAPGQVVGIDIEESQIDLARNNANRVNIANVVFQQGSVYELPFENNSFDAVFGHAIMEHLQQPSKALSEIFRVLKPGGVIGVRSPMGSGDILEPPIDTVLDALAIHRRLTNYTRGIPSPGPKFRGLLTQTGFANVQASSATVSSGTSQDVAEWAEGYAQALMSSPIHDRIVDLGWATHDTLEAMAAAWREWGKLPDAFFSRTWGQAVGSKH